MPVKAEGLDSPSWFEVDGFFRGFSQDMNESSRRKGRLLALFLLFAAVFLGHGRSLGGKFLNFDDDRIVTANPLFQAPLGRALEGILDPTRTIADAYLPVSHLSLYLDWRLFGGSPWGMHLSSLLWHFLAAAALFALGCRLGLARKGALLGALLFALHPALVEDAAWISSRKYLLAGLFTFLTLSLWISALEGRKKAAWGALVTALLAVYSNGAALVVLPFVALLSLFPPRRTAPGEKASFPWIPFLLLALVVVGAGIHHAWLASRAGTAALAGGKDRTLSMVPAVFSWYLEKAFLPLGLSVDYPYPVYLKKFAAGGVLPWVLSGGLFLAGLLLVLLGGRTGGRGGREEKEGRGDGGPGKDLRLAGLGLLLFFLGLLPFNDYLPASSVLLADRYLYLPLAGLVLALGALASGRVKPRLLWAGIPVLGICAFLPWTWIRTGAFLDSESLWKAAMAAEPGSALAPFNLATERLRKGGLSAVRGEEGVRNWNLLEKALERAVRPQLRARIFRQEAVFLAWKQDPLGAARRLGRACAELEKLPWKGPVRLAWGRISLERARRLREAGRKKEARILVDLVGKRLPGWVEGKIFRASLLVEEIESLQKKGRTREAARKAREARPFLEALAREHPRNYEALRALARLEATRLAGGRFTRAMGLLKRAEELDPGRPEAYVETANIYLAMDPPAVDSALAELEKGLSRIPGNPDLLALKGVIFFQRGRFDQGVAFLEDAFRRAPQRLDIRATLIQALCDAVEEGLQKKGDSDPGKWLEMAQKLDRNNPEVLRATGLYLAAGGKLREAVEILQRALKEGARPGPTRKALARVYRKMGYLLLPTRRALALEAFRKCLEFTGPGEPLGSIPGILETEIRKLRKQAEDALAGGKREEASSLLERAFSLADPERMPEAWALLLLDRARLEGKGRERAREEARKVLCRDLGCPGTQEKDLARAVRGLLGPKVDSWLTAGKSGKALRVLEIASRLLPAHPGILALRARVLLARGEAGACRKVLDRALARWPRNQDLLQVKGRLLCLEGMEQWKARKSPQVLEKIVEGASLCGPGRVPPEADSFLRSQAARVLEKAEDARGAKDWKKALALLEKGIHYLPPGVPGKVRWRAVLEKGLCLVRLEKPLKALRVLEALDLEARAEKVPFAPAVRARAALLAAMGRGGEAREVILSWLKSFPGDPGGKSLRLLLEKVVPASRPARGK